MNKLLIVVTLIVSSFNTQSMSLTYKNIQNCSIAFTTEQQEVLDKVYYSIEDKTLATTLQGMVILESFIWKSIDRTRAINSYDESYGILHVRPVVAEWVASKRGGYQITQDEVKPLLSSSYGDSLSIYIAHQLLLIHLEGGFSLDSSVARYNAGKYYKNKSGQKYLQSVKDNVKYIQQCGYWGFKEPVPSYYY